MIRLLASLAAMLVLAACAGERVYAPDDAVAAARYTDASGPSLTLFTVINDTNRSGAHSGLLINGSQRVVFDPAGSWSHPRAPERNDVIFGMTPAVVANYVASYAKPGYRVVEHRLPVSAEVAEAVLRRALENGPVAPAHCTVSTTGLLAGIPGLESLPRTYFPKQLMAAYGALPGVTTRTFTHDQTRIDGIEVLRPGAPPAP